MFGRRSFLARRPARRASRRRRSSSSWQSAAALSHRDSWAEVVRVVSARSRWSL